jgi:hypothetical protein
MQEAGTTRRPLEEYRMARPRPRALLVALAVVATGALIAFALMPNGLLRQATSSGPTAANPTGETAQEPGGDQPHCDAGDEANDPDAAQKCQTGYFDPRKEAKFERAGGEADRVGPDSPAAEQVDNRAYPRSYVDDRLALKGRHAFDAKPRRLHRSNFKTTAAYNRYVSALTHPG